MDLQGHGRTADIGRPIDVRLMADDIAALSSRLGLDRPDVVGWSLGGGVGEGRPQGGHALAIRPGLTHYSIVSSSLLAAVTLAFLDDQPS